MVMERYVWKPQTSWTKRGGHQRSLFSERLNDKNNTLCVIKLCTLGRSFRSRLFECRHGAERVENMKGTHAGAPCRSVQPWKRALEKKTPHTHLGS